MKTTTNSNGNQVNGAKGIFSNLKGAIEMTIATHIEKVKLGISNVLNNNTPARFLGALVLGTAMVAAAATGWTPGQVQASGNQVTVQMELGEEWFHPVTGEPIGQLPGQMNQLSQGVLASPLIIGSISSWGPAEENFHPVTGEMISAAAKNIEVSDSNLGEEYFHPVTGQPNTGVQSKMVVSGFGLAEENFHPVTGERVSAAVENMDVSPANLGEEYFHPVTGQPNTGVQSKMAVTGERVSAAVENIEVSPASLGEEYFHPISGQANTGVQGKMVVSGFGPAEENFHLVTGELE